MKIQKRILKSFLFLSLTFLIPGTVFSQTSKVDCTGFTVSDMDKSIKFYSEVLSFEKISDNEYSGTNYENLENVFGLHIRVVKMKLGDEVIELTDYLTSGGRPIPVDSRSNDLAFQHIAIVVSDMEKAYQLLRAHHVKYVSTSPQTLPISNKAAAGIRAFYFLDPDNHNLELIYFPQGKGNPKWQQSGRKLFLGIDHTAIGVSSTSNSLKFYRDLLGLELKGESFNFGTEQEHLNNIEGASLHISGLKAGSGPGVEFLEYLKPGPGQAFPTGTRSDDLITWQTTITVDNIKVLTKDLKQSGVEFVSKGTIEMTGTNGVIYSATIVKDPDGHQVIIKSPEKPPLGSAKNE